MAVAVVKSEKKRDLQSIWHCSTHLKFRDLGFSDLRVCGREVHRVLMGCDPGFSADVLAFEECEGGEWDGYWGHVPLAEYAVGFYVGHVKEYWHVCIFLFVVAVLLVREGFVTVLCFNHAEDLP